MVDIATITQQAQAMSAQNGQSPEQNAYAILKNAYGMTNAQMDSLWGFAPGSVDAVFGPQDSAGVGVGGGGMMAPAAPAASAATVQKTPASVWDAIKAGQMTPEQADSANNWTPGTTIKWAASNGLAQPITATFTNARGIPYNSVVGYNYSNTDGTVTDVSPTGSTSGTYKMGDNSADSPFGVKTPGGDSNGIFSFGQDISRVIQDPNFAKGLLTAGTMVLAGNAIAGQPTFGPDVPTGTSLGTGAEEPFLPTGEPITPTPVVPPTGPGGTPAVVPPTSPGGTPVVPPTGPGGTPVVVPPNLSNIPGVNQLPTWLQQLLPGLLTGAGGIVAGNSAVDAAKVQADAQLKAAQIAADAAKFKPVGVTTGFGSSQFGYDKNGNLISAGYQLTPQMQALRNQTMGSLGGLLNQAQGAQAAAAPLGTAAQQAITNGQNLMGVGGNVLNQAQQFFYDPKAIQAATYPMAQAGQQAVSLGQGYLSTDPQAQAAKYYADQMRLLEPTRAADMAALQAQMQAQGRGGFAIGGGVGGQGAANPQLQALLNAQLQQNNQLAADATRGGMDYAKFGTSMVGAGGDLMQGMFNVQNAAYQPYNTLMGTAQNALTNGSNLAGSGANLLTGMYNTEAAAYNPFKTALGTAQTIEGLGQDALTQGINLGSTTTAANAAAGGLLSRGATDAASTMFKANAYSPWGAALTNMGTSLSGYKFDPLTGKAL